MINIYYNDSYQMNEIDIDPNYDADYDDYFDEYDEYAPYSSEEFERWFYGKMNIDETMMTEVEMLLEYQLTIE